MGKLNSRIVACSILGVVLLSAACGSDDDGALFVSVSDTTMQALATTLCTKYQDCTSEILIQAAYGTLDGCTARVKAQFALDNRSLGYTVSDSNAISCNDALATTSCNDILDGKIPALCDFDGKLNDGNACTADAQCTSGSCAIDDAAKCGKCGPRAVLNADCTNANCTRGLQCNANNMCKDGAVGAACTRDTDCHALSYCRKGACTAPLAEGAACVVNSGATEAPCDLFKGFFCGPAKLTDPNGICKKFTTAKVDIGSKCGITALVPFTLTLCNNGDCVNSVCAAHIADGAPCIDDEDGHPKCEAPAKCRGGVCSLKDPSGCQ